MSAAICRRWRVARRCRSRSRRGEGPPLHGRALPPAQDLVTTSLTPSPAPHVGARCRLLQPGRPDAQGDRVAGTSSRQGSGLHQLLVSDTCQPRWFCVTFSALGQGATCLSTPQHPVRASSSQMGGPYDQMPRQKHHRCRRRSSAESPDDPGARRRLMTRKDQRDRIDLPKTEQAGHQPTMRWATGGQHNVP